MKQHTLGATGRAWLKGFHIAFSATWVGAMTCLLLLHLFSRPASGAEAHAIQAALRHLDDWVIIPSAMGSLLTGLLISWLTPWGFFKWPWVTLKWLGTFAVIFSGSFLVGPRLNGMEALAAAEPLGVLQSAAFRGDHQVISLVVGPQVLLLLFMVFISVLKPWKRKTRVKESRHEREATALK
ncbi:MAG: hypothetical protein HGA45_36210 [Chloroflexales bacterium]|nr:hypothetical protein [Chloroflexales bacterium]